MSREELAGMVHQQELIKLGAEGFKDAYGESAFEQLKAQTAQEKFNDILNKTMGLIADLVTPFMPLVDIITSILKIPFLPQFLAIGVAIALKKKKKNNKIFVILGDGESNEGSVWEASMAAVKFNLDNIFLIVDKNNFQQTGTTQEIMNSDNLQKKWESFGWNVNSIDGHNIDEMIKYFSNITYNQKPNALIMNTIKGKGFSFSENNAYMDFNEMRRSRIIISGNSTFSIWSSILSNAEIIFVPKTYSNRLLSVHTLDNVNKRIHYQDIV